MPQPPDPDRSFEQRRWSASGANWDRWADPLAETADRINRPLLDLSGISPGESVLDLASGAGEPALTACDIVGPAGRVVATDLVPSMLAGARRRAAERHIANLSFALADMEALPFAAGCFDRVTCRFGLMFVPDAVRAAAEMARILRPGGVAAAAAWGPIAENTLFLELSAAVEGVLGPDPGSLATLFRFAEPGSSAAVLSAGGLTGAEEQALRHNVTVPADRPFWRPTLEMAFAPRLADLDAEGRTVLDRAITARFQQLAGQDGNIPLKMHIRLSRATAG